MSKTTTIESGIFIDISATGDYSLVHSMVWKVLEKLKSCSFKFMTAFRVHCTQEGWFITLTCVIPTTYTLQMLKDELFMCLWGTTKFDRAAYLYHLEPTSAFCKADQEIKLLN